MYYDIIQSMKDKPGIGVYTMYDVIIIGAGPSGSTAAKILAEKGYKVLLIEKFKMPRYKSCS